MTTLEAIRKQASQQLKAMGDNPAKAEIIEMIVDSYSKGWEDGINALKQSVAEY